MAGTPAAGTGGVVSLVPSITETLLEWGVEVAACTRFCEQPGLRHVGGTKNPDIGAIVDLGPRVVLMDTEENRREDAEALVGRGVRVVATDVHGVGDVGPALGAIADAVGIARPPIADSHTERPADRGRRRALVPIWRRPWMLLGSDTYGASLLDAVGIDLAVFGNTRYPTVDIAVLAGSHVDMVLVPSEPYEFSESHLDELRAVLPGTRIERVDGQDLFWWGVRTPRAIARLARALAD